MVSSHDKKTMSNDQTDSSSTTDVVVQQINNQQQQQQQSNGGFVSRLASPFKSSSSSNALNKVGYKRVIKLLSGASEKRIYNYTFWNIVV